MKLKISNIVCLLLSLTAYASVEAAPVDSLQFVYKLHGQTRRFQYVFTAGTDGDVTLKWSIERNLKMWNGSFTMPPCAVTSATAMSFIMPEDGNDVTLPCDRTYAMISTDAYNRLKRDGMFDYNFTCYRLTDNDSTTPLGRLLHVADTVEGAEMWILDRRDYPVVWEMRNNPMEINWTVNYNKTVSGIKEAIERTPGKSGGIYYAYPYSTDEAPSAPRGYSPVYISHYGRHGSRWIIKEWQYPEVHDIMAEALSQGNLTPLGINVLQRVDLVWRYSKGHSGELSPLGEQQHKAIARRMFSRYPSIFSDSASVTALSSTEPRCIMSMAAFCEQLKDRNRGLRISRHATPGNMEFIAYSTPEAKAMGNDDAPWRRRFFSWCDSVIDSDRLMTSLFVNPSAVANPKRLMVLLHNIAVGQQNIESGINLLDIFTTDELYNLWRHLNYNMYVRHGAAAEGNGTGPESARSLLSHIIDNANQALATSGCHGATLRFGHDTNLIRLLTLMHIDDCDNVSYNPDLYHEAWQDFKVSPMAANLQIIFFRNDDGHVIALVRHNERPVKLPIPSLDGTEYFYDWDTLSDFWKKQL